VPNLLTVPGDPLAGAVLAASALATPVPWPAVASCLAASLALYAGGLLANDYFDSEEDARERPDRPIPSGRVKPLAVLTSALLFSVAALSFAADTGRIPFVVALLLAAATWSYNAGLKRCPVFGPLVMGVCRGLSLLLGASAILPGGLTVAATWGAAALLTLYITGITAVARTETQTVRLSPVRLGFPVLVVFAGLVALAFLRWDPRVGLIGHHASGFSLGLAAMAVIWTALWTGQLAGTPAPATVQRGVGSLIRGLILIQAALCATAGPTGELAALAVLAAFPLASWLGKWFYGS
jgi:4-hydroxybenzoate polyprenyltransferase